MTEKKFFLLLKQIMATKKINERLAYCVLCDKYKPFHKKEEYLYSEYFMVCNECYPIYVSINRPSDLLSLFDFIKERNNKNKYIVTNCTYAIYRQGEQK